jgi:hypothetical protein
MTEQKTGYRAFPPEIESPVKAARLSIKEFEAIQKVKMEGAPALCSGHKSTLIWYSEVARTYIVHVSFDKKPDTYAQSICTFTPTMGMDQFDACFAQDIEDQLIKESLGIDSPRLQIFKERNSVPIMEYLQSRGFAAKQPDQTK